MFTKFQNDQATDVGGVAFTRYPASVCFVRGIKAKNGLSSNCQKVIKIDLIITAKRHAHFPTLIKTPAKFQKHPVKIVGGVAFSRYPVSICFGRKKD